MWIRVCRYKNAGVAGYAEAFIPVQSDSQASEWYRYSENDVLASARTVFVTAALRLSVFFLISFCPARAAAAATAAGTATACTAEMFSGFSILNLFVNQEQTISDHQNQNYCICHRAFLHVFWKRPDIRNVQPLRFYSLLKP